MSKFYTTILAACVLMGASAAQPESPTSTLPATPQSATALRTKLDGKRLKAADFKLGENSERTTRRAGEDKDEVSYTWVSLGDGTFISSVVADTYGATAEPVAVKVFEAEEKPGLYKAVGVWPDMRNDGDPDFELIVDASNPEFIKVEKQFTGFADGVDGDTYIASMTWVLTSEEGFEESLVAQALPDIIPTLNNGCITFPPQSLALQWPNAPADSKWETDPTEWYPGEETVGALYLPGSEYVSPWTLLGEGTFSGDVYFSIFEADATDYTVNVYQSKSDENIYRIEDPIKGLYAALGFSGVSKPWDIDATVPDNISLAPTSSGITGGPTIGEYYMATYNQSKDDIELCPQEFRAKLVKDDKTLTFNFPLKSLLLIESVRGKAYLANKTDVNLTVTLTEDAGIGEIEFVENNAPVEYFNLQGQRVATPGAGQLMIKRQGSKVTKVVIK